MHPHQPLDNLLLVHEVMVKEELQRNNPEHHRYFSKRPRPRVAGSLRRIAARTMIAAGTWLDPSVRPVDSPSPAGNG